MGTGTIANYKEFVMVRYNLFFNQMFFKFFDKYIETHFI